MRLILTLAALACAATPAIGETILSAGGTLELYHDPAGAGSKEEVDASIYGEAEINGFYLGATALKSNYASVNEFNLGVGYRGEMSGIGYDVALTRYVYPKDAPSNYTELTLGLSKDFDDKLSGTLDFGYDLTNHGANAYIGGAYGATEAIELSANFGVYDDPTLSAESEWDIGATYAVSDEVAADLRWYDGTDYTDGYVGLIFSWDTSITK